jgi:valyl-tRNA synthetase
MRSIIPFSDVYIHATVLDEKGRRMSKSLGNGIDPIDLIDRYGADATRFSLMQQAGKNQDIKYSEQRTDVAGNFCNKLWNASRFVLMNLDEHTTGDLPERDALSTADRWILSRLNTTIEATNVALANYDMDDATRTMYQFFWNDFCDWYVEMAKPRLQYEGPDGSTVRNMLAYVLETTLRLLHPIVPFITEEIWQNLPHAGETICTAPYPQIIEQWRDAEAEAAMDVTIDATRALRNVRAELGISPAPKLVGAAVPSTPESRITLAANAGLIASLARLSELKIYDVAPQAGAGTWIGSPITGAEMFLQIGDSLDLNRELERIDKELGSIAKEIERAQAKLANPNFVERANPDVVAKERGILADWQDKRAKLRERRAMFTLGSQLPNVGQ